jgi:hypothetical protein
MILSGDSSLPVVCDWLDVTCPEWVMGEILDDLIEVLLAAGFEESGGVWRSESGGVIQAGLYRGRLFRVSCSGRSLADLRSAGLFESLLSGFVGFPYRVTRLDAAADFRIDGADAIESLHAAYPRRHVRLGQRAQKMSTMLAPRDWDGRESGTVYVGHRSTSQITCRVYDKRKEVLDRTGEDPEHDWTRVEVTVKGKSGDASGPTLRDAVEPAGLFWCYASPSIVRATESACDRVSGVAEGWSMERVELLPAQVLKGRIEAFSTLDHMVRVADRMGPEGRRWLKSRLSEKIDSVPIADQEAEEPATGTDGV